MHVILLGRSVTQWNQLYHLSELHLNPVLPASLPILFVAPNNEPFTAPKVIAATEPLVPSQEVIRIENCGHFVMLEKPDETTRIIGDWVQKKLDSEST
ncbi:hypothetical protein FRB94_010081 [Tulasnella sp. JGI-2019a]|nr:hypothetical protein FRB94_010081 [Tulasnella sp. JGI-2019a]